MDIIITKKQYDNNCFRVECIEEMKSSLDNYKTRDIFRTPVDEMLESVKTTLDPNSDLYGEVYGVLNTYQEKFKLSDEQINALMSINLVYDENNNWDPINKLNTNYSDLSVLVTDILVGEGECICKLIHNSTNKFLIDLATKIEEKPEYFYGKYLKGNFQRYINNNRENTLLGDKNELYAISQLENELGCDLIYMASEGSPIDMKLGVDAILEKNGLPFTVQVKTASSLNNTPGKRYVKYKTNNKMEFKKYVDYLVIISGTHKKKMVMLKKPFPVIKGGEGFIHPNIIVYKNF